jgi:hypothetical protein
MSKFENNMEDMFDIEVESTDIEPTKPKPPASEEKDDQTKDYEYTRGSLYSLIDKGREALDGALEVAQESGHPRAYEVAVNAMKQVADATDKLLDLQKKMKDLEAPTKNSVNNKTTNNLFVGSTADLQKMLKQINKQEESE